MHENNHTKVKLGPKKVASIRDIEVVAFQGAVFYCHCEAASCSVWKSEVAAFEGSGLVGVQCIVILPLPPPSQHHQHHQHHYYHQGYTDSV